MSATDVNDWPGHPDADPDCECCLGDGLQADGETPCPCIDARKANIAAQTIPPAPRPEGEPVTLTYTNWRGETTQRTITPKCIWWGATYWNPEPQWLLTAFDTEKQADRDFALKDFGTATPQPAGEAVPVAWRSVERKFYRSEWPLANLLEARNGGLVTDEGEAWSYRYTHKDGVGGEYDMLIRREPVAHPPQPSVSVAVATETPRAWLDVMGERVRQITVEGWTPEHDDTHVEGELAGAASAYAMSAAAAIQLRRDAPLREIPPFFMFDPSHWKPTNARRDLVKAGALILAEIERLDRAALAQKGGE